MHAKKVVVELEDGTRMALTVTWKKELEEGRDLFGVHLVERSMIETVFKEVVESLIANKLNFNSIKTIRFEKVEGKE
jgi:hypothetical protein